MRMFYQFILIIEKMKQLCITILLLVPFSGFSQSAEAKFDEGYELYLQEEYEVAIVRYSEAIALNGSNPEYYYHRGVCRSMLQRDSEAIEDFNKAIALRANYAEVYFERAYSYYILGDSEKSIRDYNKTLEINPDYSEAYMNRGTVRFDTNDLEGACSDWRKAQEYNIQIAETLLKEYCK